MSYNEATRAYFEAARGAGTLCGPGAVRGSAGSPAGGAWVQFDLELEPQSGAPPRVADARFLAFGCPHTIAAAAFVVERAVGRVLERSLPESVVELQRRFAVPVEKRGRLLVVEDAWIAAAGAAGAKD